MSDFHDCLTRKVAQVTIGEFKPGCFEQAQQLYHEAVSTYADGFDGAYLLRDGNSDRGMSIILWQSEAAKQANQNELHDTILQKMAPLFIERPQNHHYDVVSEIPGNPAKVKKKELAIA
ncbi:antibiotic biosynthesis monooxygenase [filamentous cyanobacterium LEGE 11480]|uniref:Antibiotic biosynthesis monooxygenase n=1 Tax=Romeriopsis navalis LEGE 11480 TaxID=2777977 RepID=A0A928VR26_9CYAN|nr:antibiotic biosynthesis monooxygenase [Romeriopsis navalis]MBE9030982.1 antibiotic biosynthesis monooxygenase [Romeriopsis navalis LEGE 11480]